MSEKQEDRDFLAKLDKQLIDGTLWDEESKYSVAVYDVHFYKVDADGNELLNDDGSTKLFFPNTNFDYSYLADDVSPDDLVELKS